VPAMVSGRGGKEMKWFLDHDHRERREFVRRGGDKGNGLYALKRERRERKPRLMILSILHTGHHQVFQHSCVRSSMSGGSLIKPFRSTRPPHVA
jgi:hypothetical protein